MGVGVTCIVIVADPGTGGGVSVSSGPGYEGVSLSSGPGYGGVSVTSGPGYASVSSGVGGISVLVAVAVACSICCVADGWGGSVGGWVMVAVGGSVAFGMGVIVGDEAACIEGRG